MADKIICDVMHMTGTRRYRLSGRFPDGRAKATPMTIPRKMQLIEVSATGDANNLQLTTAPTPKPRGGEVLIHVATAGINRPDLLQRRGLYPPPPGASDILGLEVDGTVVKPPPMCDHRVLVIASARC